MKLDRVYALVFASVYPLYVRKAEAKGRTQAEAGRLLATTEEAINSRLKRNAVIAAIVLVGSLLAALLMLALPGADRYPQARAAALEGAGGIAYWMGDFPEAGRLYDECLDLRRTLGDRLAQAEAAYNRACVHAFGTEDRRDPDAAEELLVEARRPNDLRSWVECYVLPILEHMGFKVISESPYMVQPRHADREVWIHDFGMVTADGHEVELDAQPGEFGQIYPRRHPEGAAMGGEVVVDQGGRLCKHLAQRERRLGIAAGQVALVGDYARQIILRRRRVENVMRRGGGRRHRRHEPCRQPAATPHRCPVSTRSGSGSPLR